MADNAIELKQITKKFPGVLALDKVDFTCRYGEVHALCGENGAGKSTLMKVLAGAYQADSGEIIVKGQKVTFSSTHAAQVYGIGIIYQEFNMIPELSVAENIFLGREPKKKMGLIDSSALADRATELLNDLGVQVELETKVKELRVAQQQMVEIAKALSLNADVLIMDEPSAVISGKELDALFRIIRRLKENGKTILYISHRMEEIFEISDRVTVLKDGRLVGTVETEDVDRATIIRMMVGRSLSETFPKRGVPQKDKKIVLSLSGAKQGKKLNDISLNIYSGEIVGIAGLVGSRRTDLARVIFGADYLEEGQMTLNGKEVKSPSPKLSIKNGLGYVTESRKDDGLVYSMSVRKNMTLTVLDKILKGLFLSRSKEKKLANDLVNEFNISTPGVEQEIQYLSGGNQQKVILAKWMNINPSLLILDEPTRGIDVGAKAEIYKLMREMANKGTAILMISSELPEILGMSDRIIVMHEGGIMGELPPDKATEEKIMTLATGNN
ncbi:MAG: sugar ABC transporter ATP-binding protein [Desulfobacterales bacterium]|jgi:ribose transport system ATP-binding protein